MAGVLANSSRVSMVSAAPLSSGYVVGERVTMSLDVMGSTYAWSVSAPKSSRNAVLNGPGTATPSFLPDVPGVYVVTCLVNGTDTYVIELVAKSGSTVFLRDGLASYVLTDQEVPTPREGAAAYYNDTAGTWRWKDAEGVIHDFSEAVPSSTLVRPFVLLVDLPSGGAAGTPDDVLITNALPVRCRLVDASIIVTTHVSLSVATIRTAAGGGGSALSNDIDTATVGTKRTNASAAPILAAGSSLYVRRSDRSMVGTALLTLVEWP